MASDSLLAHLTRRLTSQSENVATEALLYVLDRHQPAWARFESLARRLQPELGSLAGFRSQDWSGDDGAIPDLVGVGEDGSTPLVVEVKFWAPLTPNQPCAYHERLPEGGLLVFLCPRQRAGSLTAELADRCGHATVTEDRTMSFDGGRRMAVLTWHDLLDELDDALKAAGDDEGLADVRQLRGLVEADDGQVFLPLESAELSGQTGRRLTQFWGLIEAIVDRLVRMEVADLGGLRFACRVGQAYGRYFRLNGHEVQLVVHFGYWATERDTPLWLMVTMGSHRAEMLAATGSARDRQPPRLLERDGYLIAPVPLAVGVPEHAVVEEGAERIAELAALLPVIEHS